MTGRELRPFRRKIRVIFQDPFLSLNPRITILQTVGGTSGARVVGQPGLCPGGRCLPLVRGLRLPPGFEVE